MPFGAFRLNGISRAAAGRTAKTITAYNQAQIDTAQSKFGGASALFDGNNDYLIASSIADEGSGALTFEAWVRFDILPTNQTLGGGSYMMLTSMSSNSYILIQNAKVQIAVTNSYYGFTIPTIAINTWYHVAIVREADNDWFVYWNGTKITGTVEGGDTDVNKSGTWWGTEITIGKFTDTRGSWDGHIDELRISNIARYTANFTAPTAAFVNDANTLMLLHMNGADASTTFTDDDS